MRALRLFLLLLWKNVLLQRRKVLVTVFEIAIPTLFAVILLMIRQKVQSEKINNATQWPAFTVAHFPMYLCPLQPCYMMTEPYAARPAWQVYYSPNTSLPVREVMQALEGVEKYYPSVGISGKH